MPITKGAKKALRASKRKQLFNTRRKETMKKEVKLFRELVATDKKKAEANLARVYAALDKAAKTGVIKKETAARRKSRLAHSLVTK